MTDSRPVIDLTEDRRVGLPLEGAGRPDARKELRAPGSLLLEDDEAGG